jgi:hypothetical protein
MAERSKAAVLKAVVLRYRGFESLFARLINLTPFHYKKDFDYLKK